MNFRVALFVSVFGAALDRAAMSVAFDIEANDRYGGGETPWWCTARCWVTGFIEGARLRLSGVDE